jgi:hypothetical protein
MTLKYSHSFTFDGGFLEVKTSGHGDKDGSGLFVFDEETANWEAREERSGCDIVVTCAKPDMIELRDFLNRMYPIEQPSPQPGDNLTPDSAAARLYIALMNDDPSYLLYHLSRSSAEQMKARRLAAEFERLCSERITAAEKAARVGALEEAATYARCAFDDRPRRGSIDWNDGFDDGTKAASASIRALITAAEAQPGTGENNNGL